MRDVNEKQEGRAGCEPGDPTLPDEGKPYMTTASAVGGTDAVSAATDKWTRTEVRTERAVHSVQRLSRISLTAKLQPVVVAMHTGVANFQDYLTPTEARELAKGLLAVADEVEASQDNTEGGQA